MKTPLPMTTTLIRKVSMGNEIQDVIRANLTVEISDGDLTSVALER